MSNSADRYRQLCAKGLDPHQIAERLGVKKNAVYQMCKRHGIAVGVKGKTNSRASSLVKNASPHTENSGSGSHEVS
jgi:hypothetical protein